jgi:hypothetical protein
MHDYKDDHDQPPPSYGRRADQLARLADRHGLDVRGIDYAGEQFALVERDDTGRSPAHVSLHATAELALATAETEALTDWSPVELADLASGERRRVDVRVSCVLGDEIEPPTVTAADYPLSWRFAMARAWHVADHLVEIERLRCDYNADHYGDGFTRRQWDAIQVSESFDNDGAPVAVSPLDAACVAFVNRGGTGTPTQRLMEDVLRCLDGEWRVARSGAHARHEWSKCYDGADGGVWPDECAAVLTGACESVQYRVGWTDRVDPTPVLLELHRLPSLVGLGLIDRLSGEPQYAWRLPDWLRDDDDQAGGDS